MTGLYRPLAPILVLCFAIPAYASVTVVTDAPTALTCGSTGSGSVTLTSVAPMPQVFERADIMLVVDDSGSLSITEFNQLKQGLQSFVQSFTLGPDNVRIGLVQFDSSARLRFGLSAVSASVRNAINSLPHSGLQTCTSCGIALADQHLQSAARPDAARYIVVVSEGAANVEADTLASVALAAQSNATVFAVGVGVGAFAEELELIASDITNRRTVFDNIPFDGLGDIVDDMGWDLAPPLADQNVVVTLKANPALVFTEASALSGVVTVTPQQIQWTFDELPAGVSGLTFAVRQISRGGIAVPMFDSVTYTSAHASSLPAIPNPTIQLASCGPGGEDPLLFIDQLTADLSACTDVKDALAADLAAAQQHVASLEAEVATLNQKVADAQVVIGEQLARIASVEAALHASAADAAARGAAMALAVARVQADLRQTFGDPAFVIPGATVEQQLANLIDAVIALNRGRTQGLLDALRTP